MGPGDLAQVLRRLNKSTSTLDPNLLLGLDVPDDAAVYQLTNELALVQTVDFFTPVVDDPYDWGAIAVANAMSDLYAMGAKPLLGLNLVGWPKDLDLDLLADVLEGGAAKVTEAGALVVGGHTVDDPEPKFGMAVTGTVEPSKVVRQSTATAGMSLILTKPLGMGIISTAIKRGEAGSTLAAEATTLMSTLNASAAEAMKQVGPGAATDVTGFGLIGHLQQMAASSGVSVSLESSKIPVIDGVRALAERDMVPGGTRRNEDHFGKFVEFDKEIDAVKRTILFDAQTSGGLLIAVEADKQKELVAALEDKGAPAAAVIGRFESGGAGQIKVTP